MPSCCTTAPSAEDIARWQAQLVIAEDRLFKLQTGGMAHKIGTMGPDFVEFSRTNEDSLRALIAELKAKIAGQPVTGAVGFAF